ncbi:methyl-accepting chemotaxis protein [Massilia sp. R2A-15]|uniref:methyl-accepting chemotaxis protein n=1 Tax=Massilia sp. R2A-15 TaxID=3064278 RepID=UPI002735F549|nr:methyl-accepting chemotaxis protein [Massilia sp. R2A-15]WLI91480.1 methyl-accepting chemotaxis protein [Massilia sp. R2A-15]
MNSIRQLDTRTKLFASFAIVLCLGIMVAGWLLGQLAHMSDLAAQAAHKPGAAAAALARAEFDGAFAWSMGFLALELAFGVLLCFWLSAEVARPVHEAVVVARRVASGDLSNKVDKSARGEAGLLLKAMQEMNDKLVGMIIDVRAGTEALTCGAGEISAGSQDLSARTEQQAASLEETASSMEELTATVKQNADHAHQASKLAVSASEVAVKGGEVVSEVVGTMASINDSSKRIAEIIGVIDGIAFQTNILALNAAVEAARAGEQGRGFAVVASEVRNLAQRSAAAAKEIKALIDDSVEKVNAGTLLADKAGNTMNEVVTSVKRVTGIIGEIADASAEQTTGIEQVNQAIAAMDQATQQNASLVEEAAAAAASMREQAASLNRVIGGFTLATEHARPAAQVHLLASKAAAAPAEPAPSPRKNSAVRAAPLRAARRATVAKPDVDWEEF